MPANNQYSKFNPHPGKRFVCFKCDKGYLLENYWDSHVESHLANGASFQQGIDFLDRRPLISPRTPVNNGFNSNGGSTPINNGYNSNGGITPANSGHTSNSDQNTSQTNEMTRINSNNVRASINSSFCNPQDMMDRILSMDFTPEPNQGYGNSRLSYPPVELPKFSRPKGVSFNQYRTKVLEDEVDDFSRPKGLSINQYRTKMLEEEVDDLEEQLGQMKIKQKELEKKLSHKKLEQFKDLAWDYTP